ncbi:MAG TPA: hypothetical protein VGO56_03665 [Pyrinomonadaceae bacterium]|jgi:hypothetical protein|nr:hypothetical protein [Pyrinomonadaceae bacterium]
MVQLEEVKKGRAERRKEQEQEQEQDARPNRRIVSLNSTTGETTLESRRSS